MELFAPQFDDEGNLAVNPDGTLACRPLTTDEQAELARAVEAAEAEAADEQRRQDQIAFCVNSVYRRTGIALANVYGEERVQRVEQMLIEARADVRRLADLLGVRQPTDR